MIRIQFTKSFELSRLFGKTKTVKNDVAKDLVKNGFAIEVISKKNINQTDEKDNNDERINTNSINAIKKAGRPKSKKL